MPTGSTGWRRRSARAVRPLPAIPVDAPGVAIQAADPRTVSARPRGLALFGYGFRPFFLLTALYAPTAVAAWLLVLTGVLPDPGYMGGPLLHSHEMVFGFAVAGTLTCGCGSGTSPWQRSSNSTPPYRAQA